MTEVGRGSRFGSFASEFLRKRADLQRAIWDWLLYRRGTPGRSEKISSLAYELYQQRVRTEVQRGQDEDWLEAERVTAYARQRTKRIVGRLVLSVLLTALVLYSLSFLVQSAELQSMPLLPVLLVAMVFLVVVVLWKVPKLQASRSQGIDASNRFDRENEARKTLAQIVGGILLLAGLYSSARTLDLQREGQVTDRFTKAIDQLGAVQPGSSPGTAQPRINLEERLGGIFALEGIARDSPKDEWTVMEVLTAYVRQNDSIADETRQPRDPQPIPPGADIQAIMTVIGRRDSWQEKGRAVRAWGLVLQQRYVLDLRNTNLAGIDLSYADLRNAKLTGADLRGARLWYARLDGADLIGADLRGEIGLSDLNNTYGDVSTKTPGDLRRPADWSSGKLTEY